MALALLRVPSNVSSSITTVCYLNRLLNRFVSKIAHARFSNTHQYKATIRKELTGTDITWLSRSLLINRVSILLKSIYYKTCLTSRISPLASSKSRSRRFLHVSPLFLLPLATSRRAQAESHLNKEMKRIEVLLNKKAELRTLDERIELFNGLLKMGEEEIKKSENKDIVIFLGNTGAGKSVLINFLYGCTMVKNNDEIAVDPKSPIKEVTKTGILGDSCTFIPKQIPKISIEIFDSENKKQNIDFTFFDMPGLTETRGIEVALANAIIMKQIIERANSARFVMVSEYAGFNLEHGKYWVEAVKALKERFGNSNFGKDKDALCLVVTKSECGLDRVKNDIKKLMPKTPLDLSRYAIVYNPLDASDRENILKVLHRTIPYEKLDKTKISMREDQLHQLAELGEQVQEGISKHLAEDTQDEIDEAVKKIEFTYGITKLGSERLTKPHASATKAIHEHVDKVIGHIDRRHEDVSRGQIEAFKTYELLKNKFSRYVNFKKSDANVKDYIYKTNDSRWCGWEKPDMFVVGLVATVFFAFVTMFFSRKKEDEKKMIVFGLVTTACGVGTGYAAYRLCNPTPEDQMRSFAQIL